MSYDLVVSVVLYKNDPGQVKRVLESFLGSSLRIKIYVVDNSPGDSLRAACSSMAGVEYIFAGANLGYSKAHNLAMKSSLGDCAYYVVSNPDIYFEKGTLEKLFHFMEANKDIGLVMPKVLYPDGRMQYLCKLLPTPLDLGFRRFLPFRNYVEHRNEVYELRFTDYDTIMDVPYLSGSFMFIRTEVFKKVGFFDERFFMYLEDVDLSRRIHSHYRTVYYPETSVYHGYKKDSYKSPLVLRHHVVSAMKYFNKWGWLFDKERDIMNRETIERLGYSKKRGILS
jgi:GT2 family glycosyltransferase